MADDGVAIVGYGQVGRAIHELFPHAALYDPPLGLDDAEPVNASRFCFVAVPTPQGEDGSADVSIVREVVGWIESEIIVVRSTVPPGTTDELAAQTGKNIIFQPEFGSSGTPGHPFADVRNVRWLVLGGTPDATAPVARLFADVLGDDLVVRHTDRRTAELTKYMDNAFLATKVEFCNLFFDVAQAYGIDYYELRDLWLLDPRIGPSHTLVNPDERGFDGRCLPKDLSAAIAFAQRAGVEPRLLSAVRESNDGRRRQAAGRSPGA